MGGRDGCNARLNKQALPWLRSLRAVLMSSFLLVPSAAITASKPLSALPQSAPKSEPIRVDSSIINSFGASGKLVWIGGLELSSDDPMFGGFSGLSFLDAQRFVAIGDKGTLFSARLMIENGRPTGLDETSFRMLPGLSTRQKEWRRDAEDIVLSGKSAYVSFEGETRVMRYGIGKDGFNQVLGRLRLDKAVLKANSANDGLEAIAIAPPASVHAGAFVLISEAVDDGNVQGWIQHERGADAFTLPQQNGLYVTAAAFTKAGDLLILERKVSLLGGLVIQVRRVKAVDFHAGHITHSDVLLRGTLIDGFDNMEGLEVQDQTDGSSLLSLISDDNFNSFQRTIFLQFLLPAGS